MKITAFYKFFLLVKERSPDKLLMQKIENREEAVDATKIKSRPPAQRVVNTRPKIKHTA